MRDVRKEIYARLEAIQSEVKSLNNEERLWKLSDPLFHVHDFPIPDDVVNKRTAHKFALLGQVVKYLRKNAYNRDNGASASDIYRHIKHDLPMSAGTFRSQLTRFKKEGRLNYDQEKGTWNLAKRKGVAP